MSKKRHRGVKATKKQKVRNNVTAETIIRKNVASLKKCYNAAPSKSKKCRGVSALNSGDDLALIAQVFGTKSENTKKQICNVKGTDDGANNNEELAARAAANTELAKMLFLEDYGLAVPQKTTRIKENQKCTRVKNKTQMKKRVTRAEGETLEAFNRRIDKEAKANEAKLPSIMFSARKREKLKNYQLQKSQKRQEEEQAKKEAQDEKDRLGVREAIQFGEVVKAPPAKLGLKMKERKKQQNADIERQKSAGEAKAAYGLKQAPCEAVGPLSSLPASVVAKLSGGVMQQENAKIIIKVAHQKTAVQQQKPSVYDSKIEAQNVYKILKNARHQKSQEKTSETTKSEGFKKKKSWGRMNAVETANRSQLPFAVTDLFNEKSGARKWIGIGKSFSSRNEDD